MLAPERFQWSFEQVSRSMRWTIVLFSFALVAMQLELWLSDDRLPGLRALEAAVAEQSAINIELAERNADYGAEIVNLRDSREAAEERARSELGLILPGETYFPVYDYSIPAGRE